MPDLARYVLNLKAPSKHQQQAPTHDIATCHHEPFVCDEQPAWGQRRVLRISLASAFDPAELSILPLGLVRRSLASKYHPLN